MTYFKIASAGCVALLAAACSGNNTGDGSEQPDGEAIACSATNPKDGAATIDKMPGPNDNPTLRISLTFGTPSSGDKYVLKFDASQESAPPSYIYDLVQTEEGLTDDYTEVAFSEEFSKFAEPALRSVIILCEGFDRYEIEPVEITH